MGNVQNSDSYIYHRHYLIHLIKPTFVSQVDIMILLS
jgi:hypothetical protein